MKQVAVLLAILVSLVCVAQNASPAPAAAKKYVPVTKFDPSRDAAKDIAEAVAEANRSGRNVLIDIGGTWCVWCTYFDRFFEENAPIRAYRDENFVVVKVNYSDKNKNEAVISKYGKAGGYPHVFILDRKGKLLHSQDTSKLEEGRGYSLSAVAKMLHDWAPSSNPTADAAK